MQSCRRGRHHARLQQACQLSRLSSRKSAARWHGYRYPATLGAGTSRAGAPVIFCSLGATRFRRERCCDAARAPSSGAVGSQAHARRSTAVTSYQQEGGDELLVISFTPKCATDNHGRASTACGLGFASTLHPPCIQDTQHTIHMPIRAYPDRHRPSSPALQRNRLDHHHSTRCTPSHRETWRRAHIHG